MEVTLSNNQTIELTRLKIFDLDSLIPKTAGAFTHTINIAGTEHEAVFDIRKYETPPERPVVDTKILDYSEQYWELHDYNLYQAGIAHELKKQQVIIDFYEDVKDFILQNCVKLEDISKIETADDWRLIYRSVLVEQLTMEKIVETLDTVFNAEFEGQSVIEALKNIPKGRGQYNTIALWEMEVMNTMGLTELEYSRLSVDERSRKVCAICLPKIMESLESHAAMKESKSKGKK